MSKRKERDGPLRVVVVPECEEYLFNTYTPEQVDDPMTRASYAICRFSDRKDRRGLTALIEDREQGIAYRLRKKGNDLIVLVLEFAAVQPQANPTPDEVPDLIVTNDDTVVPIASPDRTIAQWASRNLRLWTMIEKFGFRSPTASSERTVWTGKPVRIFIPPMAPRISRELFRNFLRRRNPRDDDESSD